MATPLNKLPPSTDELTHGAGAQNADADADDVVNAVLQDMESELSAQEASGATEPPRRPAPTHAQPTAVPRPLAAPQTSNVTGFLGAFDINMDNLKMAAWIIVLSAIAFQPNLTRALYERIPRLSMLESYDIFVRAILLGVFFYVLLTYAKIM